MREAEYQRLKDLFEKDDGFIPTPKKTYEAMSLELSSIESTIRIFLYLRSLKVQNQSVLVCSLEEQYTTILKSIPRNFKQFYSNYENITAQNKKIAIICAREVKRSLSRTSKTNPTLKSKRINKELSCSIKKLTREEINKQKKEEKEEEQKRRREERKRRN
ncbi:uncharacterized protein VICG_01027 [Vittaforma corneae ATCC 50505]|uniref:DBINO domain-containing protein n=1 Tax=Vittaforma corneae (strain ATCC 50505) TaxID=993615 RepID=L2GND5_VITCO|nr:uncharacterized protein VICG_01027 [Vittaforma corneae ATCC 50505]ELA42010.1 hypothetical protein VICG_01027 [Vittaforma corneae ATCC 50505]